VTSPRILPFVSRADHLGWRERWKNGRWVRLSWTPEERAAILRQDEEYRHADARWELNHGPNPGGAVVLLFSRGPAGGEVTKQDELTAALAASLTKRCEELLE
jgi:hypothetical protein